MTNEHKLLASAKKYKQRHELNDNPYIWLAAPILLLAVLIIGWVRMKIGV